MGTDTSATASSISEHQATTLSKQQQQLSNFQQDNTNTNIKNNYSLFQHSIDAPIHIGFNLHSSHSHHSVPSSLYHHLNMGSLYTEHTTITSNIYDAWSATHQPDMAHQSDLSEATNSTEEIIILSRINQFFLLFLLRCRTCRFVILLSLKFLTFISSGWDQTILSV